MLIFNTSTNMITLIADVQVMAVFDGVIIKAVVLILIKIQNLALTLQPNQLKIRQPEFVVL